jgi:hypothetical protein
VTIRPGAAPTMPDAREWKGLVAQADTLAQTEIVPKEFRNRPHDIIAVALIGREMGLSPMLAMQYIHVIDGKPSVKPELMNARIRAAGHRIEVEEWTTEKCRLTGRRADGESLTVEFTMEDASRAGLIKDRGNWQKFPKAMLWARSLSMLARALFPDVILGASYTPEELGAHVNEDGEVVGADAPSSALADKDRERIDTARAEHHEEHVVEGEVLEPEDDDGEEFVQPTPPPPPTPEQLHDKAGRDLFPKGWPMGTDKGADAMLVGDGSLRYFIENADVTHERYGKKNRAQRDWCVAELQRRRTRPTSEESAAAARQPRNGDTHVTLDAEAEAAMQRDDGFEPTPHDPEAAAELGAAIDASELQSLMSEFEPTAATSTWPDEPAQPDPNDPHDQLDQPVSVGWRNLMLGSMVKYGYARDRADAANRYERWAAGKGAVTNADLRGQIAAFIAKPATAAQ